MSACGGPAWYEIRVAGVLDSRWAAWFNGLQVTGPAAAGTIAPLMGPAAAATVTPLLGPADRGTMVSLMGPADPGTATPLMLPSRQRLPQTAGRTCRPAAVRQAGPGEPSAVGSQSA